MEAVPRHLPRGGQAECCPSATSTSTSIKGSSYCGSSTETSTAFDPGHGGNEDGEPHDPVDDPAVLGDTVRDRHGKDHGDGGDNKKAAVQGPATAKDQGARQETKEALIVQTNDGHGLDAGKEGNCVAVVAQESASVEAPKSAADARFNTRAVTRSVTAAAAKPKQNAAKGIKATAMKAVAPGRRAATPSGMKAAAARKPDSECVVIARPTTCTATKTVSAATKSTSPTSPTSVSKSASAARARVKTSYDAVEDSKDNHWQRTFSQAGNVWESRASPP
ncbi:hypothetical protein MTO96_017819 [Rhipicephalus appendiculatus]